MWLDVGAQICPVRYQTKACTREHSIYLYKHAVLVQSSTVGIYGTKSFSFHQDVLSLSVVNNSCSSAALGAATIMLEVHVH